MASLIISTNGTRQGFDLPAILDKVTVIGCDDACDITLSGVDGLSHRQCSITCTPEGFVIEDLDSTNGTYANEVEIEEKLLMKEGVVYAIGEASMILAELHPYRPMAVPAPKKQESQAPASATARTEAASDDAKSEPPAPESPTAAATTEHKPTQPLADEASTKPLTPTAPLEEEKPAAEKPASEEPSPAAPAAAKSEVPAHTRPLPGRKPARRAKLAVGKKQKERRPLTDAELQQKARMLSNSFSGSGVSMLYVVIIIILSFYAGLAFYSWQSEGTPVPWFLR